MKQKIISWCAEYLIFVGGIVVLFFLISQPTFNEAILKSLTVTVTVISLWYVGAFLKFTIRKERPIREKGEMVERDRYAFPSMHALTITSASTYLIIYNLFYGIVLYLIALIIMYARIRTHMHYVVDMAAGFCFGMIFTLIFSPIFEKYISALLVG